MQVQDNMHSITLRKIAPQAPFIFAICLMIVALLAFARFVTLPCIEKIMVTRGGVRHCRALITSESADPQIKQTLVEKITQLSALLVPYTANTTQKADLSSFLETLIAVGRRADIRFVRIQPQKEVQTKDYTLAPVMLGLTTTYHELGQFMAELEKLPHLFHVDRLALDATKEGRCEVKLLISCLIPIGRPDE